MPCHNPKLLKRWCNVPGCGRLPRGLVDASDALGPAGYRCAFHGCGCCVVGCCLATEKHRPLTGPEHQVSYFFPFGERTCL